MAENVFPLYKTMLDKNVDATYLISTNNLSSTLFDVKEKINKWGIIKSELFSDLKFYECYMDMSKVYVVNDNFGRRNPIKSLFTIIKLLFFIWKNGFDVIHTDFALYGWYCFLYFYKKKIVFVQHDPFPHTGTNLSDNVNKRLDRAHRKLNKFVILNKSQYSDFCSKYSIAPDKILVNQLGAMEYVHLFSDNNIKPKKNRVAFWGRISEYKGIEYLCEAMKKVHEEIPDASLTIVGGGKLYFDFNPYSNLPYIQLINRFVDSSELLKYASEASIAVFPYTDSTQSGCVLTAYTLGIPVITTKSDTMMEIVDDGKSALTVPVRDSEALANAIIRLLDDENLQQNMHNYLLTEFFSGERSWEAITDKYLDFYAK